MYLYMYSVFAALYVFGMQADGNHAVCLATYIVLIPLQGKIGYYSWSLTKMSIYIRVFFEEENNNMHWESLQGYPLHNQIVQCKNNTIWGFFNQRSTTLLGVLASTSFVALEVKGFHSDMILSEMIISGLWIFLAIILCVLNWWITKKSFERTDNEVFDLISHYRSDLESGYTVKNFRYI